MVNLQFIFFFVISIYILDIVIMINHNYILVTTIAVEYNYILVVVIMVNYNLNISYRYCGRSQLRIDYYY